MSLKHKNEELSLENLSQHLCIEEEIRLRDNKQKHDSSTSDVHVIKEDTHKLGQQNQSKNENRKRKNNFGRKQSHFQGKNHKIFFYIYKYESKKN